MLDLHNLYTPDAVWELALFQRTHSRDFTVTSNIVSAIACSNEPQTKTCELSFAMLF